MVPDPRHIACRPLSASEGRHTADRPRRAVLRHRRDRHQSQRRSVARQAARGRGGRGRRRCGQVPEAEAARDLSRGNHRPAATRRAGAAVPRAAAHRVRAVGRPVSRAFATARRAGSRRCARRGTAPSVDFLETCDLAAYKIGSPDLTNFPLIEYVARDRASRCCSRPACRPRRKSGAPWPSSKSATPITRSSTASARIRRRAEEINLRFMERLREWSRPSGWLLGPRQRHRDFAGRRRHGRPPAGAPPDARPNDARSDHKASLEPAQFAEQVRAVREVEAVARRGAPMDHARRDAQPPRARQESRRRHRHSRGHADPREMLTSKSPGLGLSPQFVDKLVGRRLARAVARDEMFRQSDIEDVVAAGGVDGRSTSERRGGSWRASSISRRSRALSRRSACAFVEFHVSDRDLDAGAAAYDGGRKPFGFVVHAPEYCHDTLIDLCSADEAQRDAVDRAHPEDDRSRARSRAAVRMGPGCFRAGPKIVMHVGGMSPRPAVTMSMRRGTGCWARSGSWIRAASTCCSRTCRRIPGISVGAGSAMCCAMPENTSRLCRESGLGSASTRRMRRSNARGAAPACCSSRERARPYVRHLMFPTARARPAKDCRSATARSTSSRCLPVLLGVEAERSFPRSGWDTTKAAGVPRRARAPDRNPLGQPGPRPPADAGRAPSSAR